MLGQLSEKARKLCAARERLEVIKELLFALECSLMLSLCFFSACIITALVCTGLIVLYLALQGPSLSLLSLFSEQLPYGCTAGFCAGMAAAAVWFAKKFEKAKRPVIFRL